MQKTFYLILCALFVYTIEVRAKETTDSVRIVEFLPVKHCDNIKWVKRFQGDIDRYTDENRTMTDHSCDALFIGSSSINLWQNIYDDMSPMKVIRRSYGGATVRDMLYNYDVIARGYDPKTIVMYVENDFCTCDEDISVGEAYDLFRIFVQKTKKEYPDTPFFILSLKPSPSRTALLQKQLALNILLSDFCQRSENVFFIDVTRDMYDSKGNLRTDIFQDDDLHMNQTGYDLWTAKIKPLLMKYSSKTDKQ